ncbi:MAG: hypothetical protein GY830_06790 [Bacteroidetes bacterium]|nr:hypothetical protein [Bacteroidota bacterium]
MKSLYANLLLITFTFFYCSKNERWKMLKANKKNEKLISYIEINEIEKEESKKENPKINYTTKLEKQNTNSAYIKISNSYKFLKKQNTNQNLTETEKINDLLNNNKTKEIIEIIKKIEKKNKKRKINYQAKKIAIKKYCKDYTKVKEILKLIGLYTQDMTISPHINLFLKSNLDRKELLYKCINEARLKLNKKNIINSILEAIKNNDEYEIVYLHDLIYLRNQDDDDTNILQNFLKHSIKYDNIKSLNFFLKYYSKKLKFDINDDIFKYCIKGATLKNNIELLKYLLQYYKELKKHNLSLDFADRNLLQQALLHQNTLGIAEFLFTNDYINPLALDNNNYNSFYYASKKINYKHYPEIFIKMMKKCNYNEEINLFSIHDEKHRRPIYYIINACNSADNEKYYKIIDLLFTKCNVDPDSHSKEGKSILHQSIDNNNLKLLKKLIFEYNADYLIENGGLNAINYAIKKKRKDIIEFLNKVDLKNHAILREQHSEIRQEIIDSFNELTISINGENNIFNSSFFNSNNLNKELLTSNYGNSLNKAKNNTYEYEEKYEINENEKYDNLMIRNTIGNTSYVYDNSLIVENFDLIDLNEFINDNETFLIYLIQNSDNEDLYKLLINIFKNPPSYLDINKKCRNGSSFLHSLCYMNEKKLHKFAKILLKENDKSEIFNRINLYALNNQNNTAMDTAIIQKNITAIEFLCTLGYNPCYNNIHNGTAIHQIINYATYQHTPVVLIYYSLFLISPREFDSKSMYIILYFLEGCKAYNCINEYDSSFNKPKDILKNKIDNAFNIREKRLKKLSLFLANKKYKSKFKKLFWLKRLNKAKFPLPNQNELACFTKFLDNISPKNRYSKYILGLLLLIVLNLLGCFLSYYNEYLSLFFFISSYLFLAYLILLRIYLNISLFYP